MFNQKLKYMTKNARKPLEVKVVIPQEVLDNDSELQKIYDPKKKSLKYDLSGNLPNEVVDDLKKTVELFHGNEISRFNPLVAALDQLQSFKDLAYDKENEKESIQQYKDAKKFIGSFNSSLRDVKKILKEPHKQVMDQIEALFKHLVAESENTKNALTHNYDEYLQEEERKKKEREDKKKAAELAQIEALKSQNDEMLKNSQQQTIDTAYLNCKNSISEILTRISSAAPTLNQAGLQMYLDTLGTETFEGRTKDFNISVLSPEQLNELTKLFSDTLTAANNVITTRINLLESEKTQSELSSQNQQLAQENKEMAQELNDLPFQVEEKVEEKRGLHSVFSDEENFQTIGNEIADINFRLKTLFSEVQLIEFKHSGMEQTRSQLLHPTILPQMVEWMQKTDAWMSERVNRYTGPAADTGTVPPPPSASN